MVPGMVILAAAGIDGMMQAYGNRRWSTLSVGLVAACLAAILSNLRINPENDLDAMAYANLGAVLAQRGGPGDLESATRVFEASLQMNPNSAGGALQSGHGLFDSGRYCEVSCRVAYRQKHLSRHGGS